MRMRVVINEASPIDVQAALEIAQHTDGRQDLVFLVDYGRLTALSVTKRDWNVIAVELATAGAHFSVIS